MRGKKRAVGVMLRYQLCEIHEEGERVPEAGHCSFPFPTYEVRILVQVFVTSIHGYNLQKSMS